MKKDTLFNFFLFVAPILLWLFLLRDFILGHIPVSIDTAYHYAHTKYIFNNILNGTIPLWEPFLYQGRPHIEIFIVNFFNPLTWSIALMVKCGLDYYHAFLFFITGYFLLGAAGFYWLTRELFKNKLVAYAGYLLVLFSGIGLILFVQVLMCYLFVPVVWFLYFSLRFARNKRRKDLLGATISLMVIPTSYHPFYFVTVFLVSVVIGTILYFNKWKVVCAGVADTFKKNKVLFIFCFAGCLASASPLLVYKHLSSTGDVINPARHIDDCNFSHPNDRCYASTPKVSYHETVKSGTLGERVVFDHLFSHLDKSSYLKDDFFYVPIFCYLIIFLGLIVPLNRTKVLIALTGLTVLLISLGDMTPVGFYFYKAFFFFKYFRNALFYMALLMPIVVLFSLSQMESLLATTWDSPRRKYEGLVYIWIIHAAVIAFLFYQGDIIWTSFETVVGSLGLVSLLWLRRGSVGSDKNSGVYAALLLLVFLQPAQVFYHYTRNAERYHCVVPARHEMPRFHYQRRSSTQAKSCPFLQTGGLYARIVHLITFEDDAAVPYLYPNRVGKWIFYLTQKMDESILARYVRHKFILYDRVMPYEKEAPNIPVLQSLLKENYNLALVRKEDLDPGWEKDPHCVQRIVVDLDDQATVLTRDTADFQVTRFDVNSLELAARLKKQKFLVYTDVWHSYWKVYINGERAKLYRANMAFKGVWIPAGDNHVKFVFAPFGGKVYILSLIIVYWIFFAVFLFFLFTERKGKT